MRNKLLFIGLFFALGFVFLSCEKDDVQTEPMLIVKFKFDDAQLRLNNLGQPSAVLSGNAAQSPVFNTISAHYIELTPNAHTQIGQGAIVYHASETFEGGSNAIDFSSAKIVAENDTFIAIPLSQIQKGNYEWIRVSLSYQNYDIKIRHSGNDYTGTLASFVGFNSYIATHEIGNTFFEVNANRLQGYWAFALQGSPYSAEGQAPIGATTVPNPLAPTAPIPAGSCVVTGKFPKNLNLTGNQTIEVTLSLSGNNSFEWHEVIPDGKYEPFIGENIVDMGLWGLFPTFRMLREE